VANAEEAAEPTAEAEPAVRALPADREWRALRDAAADEQQRACLTAAARQADRVWILLHNGELGPATDVLPPRSLQWHRLALAFHGVLGDSDAYAHLAHTRPRACAAAEPVIAQWLNSRDPQDQAEDGTVATRLGIGDAFHRVNTDTQVAYLSTLVTAAQEAGVFGVPDHWVDIVMAAGSEGLVRAVVDGPDGPALASATISLTELIGTTGDGIVAATAALHRIAEIITDLFSQFSQAVWHSPPPRPAPGGAFPELRVDRDGVAPRPTAANPESDRGGRAR
jgi:hypothetical protein